MALYDKASLVLIPSGTKEGVVFSQKPTNGDGDFTFSRSTAATRVNADGLIEKETQNLLLQSNSFDTTWATGNSPTLTSGQSGYDGSSNAWLLSKPATNFVNINQYASISGVVTYSVYLKAGTNSTAILRALGGTDNQFFIDLSNGTSTFSSATIIDYVIEDVGSGWYRTSISVNDSGSVRFFIYPEAPFSSTTAGNIYIQDAQLEQGLLARDYIETTTAAVEGGITDNVPRLDYTDSSCPALLLEPQRTNVVPNSEYFDGSSWFTSNLLLEANSAISPEGVQNAYKLIPNTTLGVHLLNTFTSNNAVYSVFAKQGGYKKFRFNSGSSGDGYASYDLDLGEVVGSGGTYYIDSGIVDYGNGWYRCYIVLGATSGSNTTLAIEDNSGSVIFSGDGTSGIYVYGAQAEEGTYATSYIPTYGTSVTFESDAPYITGQSGVIGQTEGTMFIDFIYTQGVAENRFSLSDDSAINWLFIATPESGAVNASRFYVRVNNVVIVDFGSSSYFTDGQRYKLALAYKSGDWAVYGNGTQLYSGSDTIPAFTNPLDTINFNSYISTNKMDEKERVNQALLFKTRLTNEELATLTTL